MQIAYFNTLKEMKHQRTTCAQGDETSAYNMRDQLIYDL